MIMIIRHQPNFDIETVRTFFAVAQSKNFTDAAELLHKTPAAVSYRIRALENQFGSQLFIRKPHALELTEAGRVLLKQFEKIDRLLDAISPQLAQLASGVPASFRIGVSNLLLQKPLAKLIFDLKRAFPKTEFSFQTTPHSTLWTRLVNEDIDFAVGLPQANEKPIRIQTIDWGYCHWQLSHKTEKGNNTIEPESELTLLAITSEKNNPLHQTWLQSFGQTLFVNDTDSVLELVKLGVGAGFLPQRLVQKDHLLYAIETDVGPGLTHFLLGSNVQAKNPIIDYLIEELKTRRSEFALTDE
ncbi:MAG TPA: LysR family transcriptional regulator [Candidatus Aphodousia faecipullorum]|nr:LysR family transcriptional regulator [Candidatus Aphodousia faecipullorum]